MGKKSKLIRFFDSWGRNPVFQFLLEPFEEVGRILGPLEPSNEIESFRAIIGKKIETDSIFSFMGKKSIFPIFAWEI